MFYFAGDRIGEAAQRELAAFVAAELGPHALKDRSAYFKARALSPALEAALETLFGGVALSPLPSLLYRFDRAAPAEPPRLDGIRLVPIDRALLERADLEGIAGVRGEIAWMWPSLERFFEYGLGCAAIAGQQVVCWCTAEYLSTDRCGIGIETVEPYQGRGIATATATQFVRQCLGRGIVPYWECRTNNSGSVRVAEKVGFTWLDQEPYWAGMFDPGT